MIAYANRNFMKEILLQKNWGMTFEILGEAK